MRGNLAVLAVIAALMGCAPDRSQCVELVAHSRNAASDAVAGIEEATRRVEGSMYDRSSASLLYAVDDLKALRTNVQRIAGWLEDAGTRCR